MSNKLKMENDYVLTTKGSKVSFLQSRVVYKNLC